MIIELIVLIIFVCSLVGILFILGRKVSNLNSLPHTRSADIRGNHIIANLENKIKNIFILFEKQILLHKFLSWVKVMTLKIETRTDVLLHKIRHRAQQIEKQKKEKK